MLDVEFWHDTAGFALALAPVGLYALVAWFNSRED